MAFSTVSVALAPSLPLIPIVPSSPFRLIASLPSAPLMPTLPGSPALPTLRVLFRPNSTLLSVTVVMMLPAGSTNVTVSPSLTLSLPPLPSAILKPVATRLLAASFRSPTFTALVRVLSSASFSSTFLPPLVRPLATFTIWLLPLSRPFSVRLTVGLPTLVMVKPSLSNTLRSPSLPACTVVNTGFSLILTISSPFSLSTRRFLLLAAAVLSRLPFTNRVSPRFLWILSPWLPLKFRPLVVS